LWQEGDSLTVSEEIIAAFASLGEPGLLVALAVIIWIDGVAFPTFPEFWLIWIFGVHPDSVVWGIALVVVSTSAALLGNLTLYGLVKMARLPGWIQRRMKQYTNFLIVKDERLILINKIAPIVPYTGAFMAVCGWNLRRCIVYAAAGGSAKTSVILLISWASYDALKEEIAPWIAMAAIAVMMVASFVSSVLYRRKHITGRAKEEPSRSQ
jgi:hypothetical protein